MEKNSQTTSAKTASFAKLENKYFGEKGTSRRKRYEAELNTEIKEELVRQKLKKDK
ncbi:hypothetical protein HB364_21670 [Pseudoflavitalea sp. X16]|uniref:hypothetical protein n=1 Tax=Paraflavitalea devenefica TaxID=2716334 RepID=UPI001421AD39|nr:hypothetical protein [Paraflavitalea devenefica]NII27706.1 hypothetical protein [Paraflavitalea devenefica]